MKTHKLQQKAVHGKQRFSFKAKNNPEQSQADVARGTHTRVGPVKQNFAACTLLLTARDKLGEEEGWARKRHSLQRPRANQPPLRLSAHSNNNRRSRRPSEMCEAQEAIVWLRRFLTRSRRRGQAAKPNIRHVVVGRDLAAAWRNLFLTPPKEKKKKTTSCSVQSTLSRRSRQAWPF